MQTERMLNFMQLSRLPGKKILQQTTKSQPWDFLKLEIKHEDKPHT